MPLGADQGVQVEASYCGSPASGALGTSGSSGERSPQLPDVPSAPEAGLPQYEATTWTPWSAPKGTPAPVVRFLYEQIQVALRSDEVLAKLRQLGNEAMTGLDPERTRGFIAAEIEKWLPVVRATGATVD